MGSRNRFTNSWPPRSADWLRARERTGDPREVSRAPSRQPTENLRVRHSSKIVKLCPPLTTKYYQWKLKATRQEIFPPRKHIHRHMVKITVREDKVCRAMIFHKHELTWRKIPNKREANRPHSERRPPREDPPSPAEDPGETLPDAGVKYQDPRARKPSTTHLSLQLSVCFCQPSSRSC